MIIPNDRRVTWQNNVGVPGGIPNRTTIFANVKNAPYNASGNGINDDTAEIQAALDACPSGQVVYIPSGVYKTSSSLILKNGYTVRGDGTNTVISGTISSNGVFHFSTETNYEFPWYPTPTYETSITAGATKESMAITVSSTGGMTVGGYLMIDCLNDTDPEVSPTGNEGLAGWNSRGNGIRAQKQLVEITNIAGSNISFTPALYLDYVDTPKAIAFQMNIKYAGIEDLKVFANDGAGGDKNFQMWGAAYCWLKDIESDYADGDHINAANSFRCEIRDSYFHDGFIHSGGSTDDCLKFIAGTSGFLIENNILRRMHVGIMFWGGGGGHVIGYNYINGGFNSDSTTALFPDISFHGAHPMQILFEGNVINSFNADGTWGTASHGTLLRNVITGENWCWPPFTGRSAENTSSPTKQYAGGRAINLGGFGNNTYFNVVGNALGTATMGNYPSFNPVYMVVAPTNREYDHAGYVFSLGYANGSDDGSNVNDNDDPYTTLLNHGNWDIVNNTQTWDGGIADHDIPNSYYLSSKPSWFGNMTWPAVNPASPPTYSAHPAASNTLINPAQYRYVNGQEPPPDNVAKAKVFNMKRIVGIRRVVFGAIIGFLGLIFLR